jgi:hypothetical protein
MNMINDIQNKRMTAHTARKSKEPLQLLRLLGEGNQRVAAATSMDQQNLVV